VAVLDVPGATLHYDLQGTGPVLLLAGVPMDASGFAPIVPLLAVDHTVVTYDPRGIARSTVADPDAPITAATLAEDLHLLLAAVTTEPAEVLASSGGATVALELAIRHPEQVRTLVAHEPPLTELLPEAADCRREYQALYESHRTEGTAIAMGRFLVFIGIAPPEAAGHPLPLPPEHVRDGGFFLRAMLRSIAPATPDLAALRTTPTRIVVAAGETSKGQLANRTAVALAERLGVEPALFPGDHGGFAGEPEAFATRLREILSA
jgi:clorobiocin/coumermycin A biosynthesis protein CloN7/CouN7